MLKKLLLAIAIAFAVIFIVRDLTEGAKPSKQSNEHWERIVHDMTIDAPINNLSIETDVISIRTEPSLDDQIHIIADSELSLKELQKNFHLDIVKNNHQLNITIKGVKKSFNLTNWNKTKRGELIVQLPPDPYNYIELKTNVGNIHHTQIDTKMLEVENDVGEIQVHNTRAELINANGSVGAIKMYNVAGQIEVSNSTGLVEMHVETIEDNIQIENDIGAVNFTIEEQPENLRLDLSTDLGTIHTNLDIERHNDSNKSVQGSLGTGGPTLKIKTDIGKIEVLRME